MKPIYIALLAFSASLSLAQGHGTNRPSPELDQLGFLVGTWVGKQSFQMDGGKTMDADITLTVSKEVGGRYLQEKSVTTLPSGSTGSAIHMLAYDSKLGRYKVWWFNDTSVDPQMLTGAWRGNKLVLRTPSGEAANHPVMRVTYTEDADDHFTYQLELRQGSGWRTLFVTDYHRS